jgi:hypothetical protein
MQRGCAAAFPAQSAPQTTLTVVPEDSAQGYYRYHVYWRGEDSDGRILRYIFAITDTLSRNEEDNWNPGIAEDRDRGIYTTKTDSVFIFNSARGRQAFNITSIDDFGDRDPSPARAYFRIVDNGLPCVHFLVSGRSEPATHGCTRAAKPARAAPRWRRRARFPLSRTSRCRSPALPATAASPASNGRHSPG